MQLFCLPYAGGSAQNYLRWKQGLPESVRIIPLELAGRMTKLGQAPYPSLEAAAEDVKKDFYNTYSGGEYALFGHSLGGWIAYELYLRLLQENMLSPTILFISGIHPPFYSKELYVNGKMDDETVVKRIKALGGTNDHTFENPDLRETYLSLLREDFRIAGCYHPEFKKGCIVCELVVMGGMDDDNVSTRELLLWRESAGAACMISKIAGNHFYPFTNVNDTLAVINQKLPAE